MKIELHPVRWMKPHPTFPKYWITQDGKIWSTLRNRWLNPYTHRSGHKRVDLSYKGFGRGYYVHTAVLETHTGKCPENKECRHLNGNPADNRLENLRWGTRSENQKDSVRHGTSKALTLDNRGEKNGMSKLTESDVKRIIWCYFKEGLTGYRIAKCYNLSMSGVYNILRKKRWAHVWKELTWI